jgi:glycosyltransferase involved in cell wall biosynthesis
MIGFPENTLGLFRQLKGEEFLRPHPTRFMHISIVIPAYNEAKYIADCVRSTREAMAEISRAHPGVTWRMVVTDNNSTDGTGELARAAGADAVVFEPVNQISRARNAGATAALAEVPASPEHWLVFLDADSRISPGLIEEMLDHARGGRAAGGAALLRFEPTNSFMRLAEPTFNIILRVAKATPGAFIFCRSDAFVEIGGFRNDVFAGEDAYLGYDVRRWGRARGLRLVMLTKSRVITSSRKLALYRPAEIATLLLRFVFSWKRLVTDKSKLALFYDGRRETGASKPAGTP